MKNQALFFLRKVKVKKIKCRLLQFLFGALRVKAADNFILSFFTMQGISAWMIRPA